MRLEQAQKTGASAEYIAAAQPVDISFNFVMLFQTCFISIHMHPDSGVPIYFISKLLLIWQHGRAEAIDRLFPFSHHVIPSDVKR